LKAIYLYDTTSRAFQGSKLVDDDYVATAGETEIKPADGLYEPVTFPTDYATAWVGTDQAVWQAAQDAANAEYIKEHPELAPQPTTDQQMIMAQAQQLSTMQQMMMAQAADLAALKTIKEAE